MALTLLDCAHWQQRVYVGHAVCQFDAFRQEAPDSPWAMGVKRVSVETRLLVIRGSVTRLDWFEDFRSQEGIEDGQLGTIPQGFAYGLYEALQWAWDALRTGPMVPFKTIIVGHSLGAAHAALLAGLMMAMDRRPNPARKRVQGLVLFGCPRAGQQRLRELIADIPFVRSFRNRQDPVCEVPISLPILEPWVQACEVIELDEAPPEGDHSLLADHHIDLYARGAAKRDEVIVA